MLIILDVFVQSNFSFQAHYDNDSDSFYIAAGHNSNRDSFMSIWRAETGLLLNPASCSCSFG